MKIKYIIIAVLLIGFSFKVSAQKSSHGAMEQEQGSSDASPEDTIRYTVPGQVEMLILSPDYDLLRREPRLLTLFTDFQRDFALVQADMPEAESYRITYLQNVMLEIEEKTLKKKYNIVEGQASVASFTNEAILRGNGITVIISFSEAQVLLDAELLKAAENLAAQLPSQERQLKVLRFEGNDLNVSPRLTEDRTAGNLDMLSFVFGVGANMIRNQFMTDVRGEIGVWLNKKGVLKNQFYASTDLLFAFNPEQQAVINNFVNLGFRRNFSSNPSKDDWLGFEVGYLVREAGDIFPSNTMKMGLNWSVGNKMTVAPQIYFNGAFQQVSPAIRIGFGL